MSNFAPGEADVGKLPLSPEVKKGVGAIQGEGKEVTSQPWRSKRGADSRQDLQKREGAALWLLLVQSPGGAVLIPTGSRVHRCIPSLTLFWFWETGSCSPG